MEDSSSSNNAIFIKKAIGFRPKGQITHLCASNGEMLLVIGARQFLHYPLQNVNRQIDVVLPLSMHDRIAYVHLNPSGRHAVVSTTGGDNFYINLKNDSSKHLKKLKGLVISSIGWNLELSTDNETGFIVLGTTKGSLVETSINASGIVAYHRELTNNLSGVKDLSITGIEMYQCEEENERPKWVLFICVPGRLYCLSGQINIKHDVTAIQPVVGMIWSSAFAEQSPAVLHPLFASKAFRYHSMDDEQRNLPSIFVVYPKINNEPPKTFCWVGSDGYTVGRLDLTATEAYDMVIKEAHIQHHLMDGRYIYPLDIALTEYNVLLLYSNHIEAVSLLNQRRMFEDVIGTDSGQVKGMCRDAISEMIWVYTDAAIWKYRPNEESRDIWQIYLERGEYGKARAITNKLSNPAPHQLVIKKEAEKYIAEKNFTAAAEILAESTDPFEVTVLKFLSTREDRRNGLKRFLELKLNAMSASEDKIRRDVLVLWLLEVQLTEFAELRRNEKQRQESEPTDLVAHITQAEQQIRNMRQQIELFLARSVVLATVEANRGAVYRLITSHAHFDIQLYLARKLKDYATMLDVYLLQSEYEKALEVIRKQHLFELYYKHSPLLIEKIPTELIAAWIEEGKPLVSDRLLPALYRCQDVSRTKMVTAAFKYLNFVINEDLASREMHNFMITLCAEFKPEELINYFEKYGYERTLVPYDVDYALRVCVEKQALKRCCVFLYCVDELYDEAVSLALTIDVELAKTCAKRMFKPNENGYDFLLSDSTKPKFSEDMRRRVWLQIARFVIERQKDVAACVSLLKESNNAIKIQDLLPFFPEFATIEHFKGPLCECLKEHSGKMKQLQEEMRNATEVAQQIRDVMEKMRTKFTVIRAHDQCASCLEFVMTRPFYAFTCRHFFHKDCLEAEMKSHWSQREQEKYASLVEKERIMQLQLEKSKVSSSWTAKQAKDYEEDLKNLRNEINDTIAGDCVLCGDVMIDSVDKPFFTEEEYEAEMATW